MERYHQVFKLQKRIRSYWRKFYFSPKMVKTEKKIESTVLDTEVSCLEDVETFWAILMNYGPFSYWPTLMQRTK